MPKENGLSANKLIIAFFLFVFFYALLFVLSSGRGAIEQAIGKIAILNALFILPSYDSPMFFLLPAIGFFLVFLLVDWISYYFETKQALSLLFPIVLIAIAFIAYITALYWYYGNLTALQSNAQVAIVPSICFASSPECNEAAAQFNAKEIRGEDGRIVQQFSISFWDKLHGSAYFLFVWGGLLGWLSRYLVEKVKV